MNKEDLISKAIFDKVSDDKVITVYKHMSKILFDMYEKEEVDLSYEARYKSLLLYMQNRFDEETLTNLMYEATFGESILAFKYI